MCSWSFCLEIPSRLVSRRLLLLSAATATAASDLLEGFLGVRLGQGEDGRRRGGRQGRPGRGRRWTRQKWERESRRKCDRFLTSPLPSPHPKNSDLSIRSLMPSHVESRVVRSSYVRTQLITYYTPGHWRPPALIQGHATAGREGIIEPLFSSEWKLKYKAHCLCR